MNKYDIKENGEVTASKRKYNLHLCAVGTMEEVIKDPYPDDPHLPKDLPTETLESIVYGEVSWLVDNPGAYFLLLALSGNQHRLEYK